MTALTGGRRRRGRSGSFSARRSKPRRTARCITPSTSSQLSRICCATAAVVAGCSQSITTASHSAVLSPPRWTVSPAAFAFVLCFGDPARVWYDRHHPVRRAVVGPVTASNRARRDASRPAFDSSMPRLLSIPLSRL